MFKLHLLFCLLLLGCLFVLLKKLYSPPGFTDPPPDTTLKDPPWFYPGYYPGLKDPPKTTEHYLKNKTEYIYFEKLLSINGGLVARFYRNADGIRDAVAVKRDALTEVTQIQPLGGRTVLPSVRFINLLARACATCDHACVLSSLTKFTSLRNLIRI